MQLRTKLLFPTIPHVISIHDDSFEVVHRAEEAGGTVESCDGKIITSDIDKWDVI